MKQRKRTSKDVPAKGRLRDMADRLWSLAIRKKWNNRCAVCGEAKCEAHHLVPRQHEATRYSLLNGIALCPSCHKFDRDLSPHQNAAGWMEWLQRHQWRTYSWYLDNRRKRFGGTKNAAYYCDTLRLLIKDNDPEDVRKICGIKFSEWLTK